MEKLIDPQQIAMADNRKIKMMGQRIEGMMRQLEQMESRIAALEAKPKRGRPPKTQPHGENQQASVA